MKLLENDGDSEGLTPPNFCTCPRTLILKVLPGVCCGLLCSCSVGSVKMRDDCLLYGYIKHTTSSKLLNICC
jgi:hypothetical protein